MLPQALSFYHIINVERKEKSGEEGNACFLLIRVIFIPLCVDYK